MKLIAQISLGTNALIFPLKKGQHKTKSERKKMTVGVQALAALAALVYLTVDTLS